MLKEFYRVVSMSLPSIQDVFLKKSKWWNVKDVKERWGVHPRPFPLTCSRRYRGILYIFLLSLMRVKCGWEQSFFNALILIFF